MRAEIAAISFYLRVIDFFFSSRLIFLNTLFCVFPSRLFEDNRTFKRLCLIMHPTLIFLRSQELTALNGNEETSFCIVLDKFLFHKKKSIFSLLSRPVLLLLLLLLLLLSS